MEPNTRSDRPESGSSQWTRRTSHYDEQRASLRSRTDSPPRSRSRPVSGVSAGRPESRSRPISGIPSLDTQTAARLREEPHDEYSLPATYENLNELNEAASPVENRDENALYRHESLEDEWRQRRRSGKTPIGINRRSEVLSETSGSQRRSRNLEAQAQAEANDDEVPSDFDNLNELLAPPPVEGRDEGSLRRHTSLENERKRSELRRKERHPKTPSEKALPPDIQRHRDQKYRRDMGPAPMGSKETAVEEPNEPAVPGRASKFQTQLYTVSYLIFFSFLGTLARLGVQWLTFYPGAPVTTPVLWANFGGSLVMGFLAEDRRLFRSQADIRSHRLSRRRRSSVASEEAREAITTHNRMKKTVPLYIGLATGFCGSFTSFSSFMRDAFLALSNDISAPPYHPSATSTTTPIHRYPAYSLEAVLAILILHPALALSALTLGAHLAILLDPILPTFPPPLLHRILDPLAVLLGPGGWLALLFLTIFPPDRPGGSAASGPTWSTETWRGQALFALLFAPAGCLTRFLASLRLNGLAPAFPLGTFAVNVFGTAVLATCWDLQHVRLGGGAAAAAVGGGRVGCQVLQGVMDGFCGCLTTVSTWVAELHALRRRHAWVYGVVSVGVAGGICVVVMGGVRWGEGWEGRLVCTTSW